jgi:8-oxo-dGTP pyrophosphatase MutT (NUDIX family)
MKYVDCINTKNEIVSIAAERLTFRPSAYGLVVNEGKALVVPTKSTGKYFLPGGGIEVGERAEETVVREVFEETGQHVKVTKFEFVNERFFYVDPIDEAWHVHGFVYRCDLVSPATDLNGNHEDELNTKAQWVEISTLKEEDFHITGKEIMDALGNKN